MSKVLIISHNPLSKENNMGKTLSNLFYAFDNSELAQLYLYPGYPDVDNCHQFYQVTDGDIINYYKMNRKSCGRVLLESDALQNDIGVDNVSRVKKLLYKIGARKSAISYVLRDLIWRKKAWLNENLLTWLTSLQFDVIFYAAGDSCFSFNIALEISKIFDKPIVSYFCDDYYFYSKFNLSPIYYVYRCKYKRYMRTLIARSSKILYISESMEKAYYHEFGRHGHVVMTPSDKIITEIKDNSKKNSLLVAYIGNIVLRTEALIEIGNTIEKLRKENINVEFHVYTRNNDPKLITQIKECQGIILGGSLDSEGVEKVFDRADVLVHVESFKSKLISRNRYSISTKIPETLGRGKCLFAYGPEEVASIEYLKSNRCACICSDKNKLFPVLKELTSNYMLRRDYQKAGLRVAKQNHEKTVACKRLRELV